jgi:hypothetical protein
VVIVFAAEAGYWVPGSRRIAAGRPGVDGRFRFADLPPGRYLIGAVTDVEQDQWFDAAFLEQLKAASLPITLPEGGRVTQNIRIGR